MGFRSARHRSGFTLVEVIVVLAIVGIIAAVLIPVFAGKSLEERRADAIRTAETFGFSNISVVESNGCASVHGCGEDDAFAYDMTGVNVADRSVAFVVCCGFQDKGCTVRTR
ncbi:type II secretion system protein [Candidatus Uhrbacteria bacterium]|nr:type II secretion system protein [Candidatus Uhrbacteria bacterium]